VVEPLQLKNVYGLDAFRFFLMRDMVFGLDSNFSEEALVQRINSDLANDLGNLFSRVVTMAHKYFKGVVPVIDPDVEREFSLGLAEKASQAVKRYQKAMENFAFHKALGAIWEFINQMNKYVDVTAPWMLAKNKSGRPQLEVAIYNLLEGLRVVAGLIYPVMPDTAATMTRHLGLDAGQPFFKMNLVGNWKMLTPGIQLPKSTTLFPRIELQKKEAAVDTEATEKALSPPLKPEITIDDFGSVDLRVATVVKAEAIPRAKKLLKLEVDLGEPQTRTVVAGIAAAYAPEGLVGKQVIVVANLKPAKLMGVQSQGMVLAASNDKGTVLLAPSKPMLPGTSVR
jgi:methionyl-tRNA synthetase